MPCWRGESTRNVSAHQIISDWVHCSITQDYGDEDDTDAGEAVRLTDEIYCEKTTANRAVTSLDWCTQKPELMCASYNANPDTPHAPDGIVCLWNRFSHATPQDVFECQSSVLSCSFTPFSPHVIVGGTYSGQVSRKSRAFCLLVVKNDYRHGYKEGASRMQHSVCARVGRERERVCER